VQSIVVISNLYAPTELGGYEILAKQICEDLVVRGFRVVVLTTGGLERTLNGVEIWPRLKLTRTFDRKDNRSAHRRWWIQRQNLRATREALAEVGADATLCFSLRRLTLGPAIAMEESTVPRLFVVNDAWPLAYRPRPYSPKLKSKIAGWVDRSVLSSMTTLRVSLAPALLLSHSLREELAEAGVLPDNEEIAYQGVSTQRFRPTPKKKLSNHVRLLYAGQLHGYKGVHHLLEAMKKLEVSLPFSRFSLTIAGRGDSAYTAKLQERAERLQSTVRFLGHVPFSDMPKVYHDHHVLVFPSTWNEPMGLCHLEAMASGLPAVVASAGGCRELIERCPYIVSYPAGDTDALARALAPLIRSPRRRRLAGAGSRRWVVKNASLADYIDRIESALNCDRDIATIAPMTPM
jgi:glycosyltransferase involved in cell wall biosynthesis